MSLSCYSCGKCESCRASGTKRDPKYFHVSPVEATAILARNHADGFGWVHLESLQIANRDQGGLKCLRFAELRTFDGEVFGRLRSDHDEPEITVTEIRQ